MQWICRGSNLAGPAAVRSALSLFLLPTLVAADEVPPAAFPVEAQIVYVQVSVTDNRGRRVRDLAAEDFVLYEDGRPVPIAAFRAPAGAKVSADAPAPFPPPPGTSVIPTE